MDKEGHGYYLTRNGQTVGTPLPSISMSFYWNHITVEMDAEGELKVVGDFLLLISESTPITISSQHSVHLCLFEEEPMKHWHDGDKIWDDRPLLFCDTRNDLSVVKRSWITFNGAIYVPVNPAIGCRNDYRDFDFIDKTSKGRWLFPHPDGSRAAYEHMQETTSEDDYQRMMPHFEEYPELLETFVDLI